MRYKIIWFIRTLLLRFVIRKIGPISYFAKPIYIYGGNKIEIGNRVRIFPGARMEVHNNGRIIIADNVSIGQNFHLISSGTSLTIGKDTTISGNVFITNVDHDYTEIGVHILDQSYIENATVIGENCFIGYGAVIQAGTNLGKQTIVGANAVVSGSFPDRCVLVGSPAKILKKYDPISEKWVKST